MNKYIFALLSALCLITIPQNVNATTQTGSDDDCVIAVASDESATINYATNCRIENNGTLTIANGANIVKKVQDNNATINNNGTLYVRGGYVEAYYGYPIRNYGKVYVYGGTINSPLHQAIWGKSGSDTYVYGGTIKSAIGGEEAIYTKGSLTICGGSFSSSNRSNLSNDQVTEKCPKQETKTEPAKTETKSTSSTTETKSTAKASTKVATTAKTEEKTEEQAEEKTGEKAIAAVITPKANKAQVAVADTATDAETLPEAGTHDNTLPIIIATAISVIGSASAAILISKLHR